jgi:hypothetical protein
LAECSQKWPVFFSYETYKTGIFTDFGTGTVSKMLSYFDEMESKMLFLQGAEFFTLAEILLKRVGNTEEGGISERDHYCF